MSWRNDVRCLALVMVGALSTAACSDATEGGEQGALHGGITVSTTLEVTVAPIGAPVTVSCAVIDGSGNVLDMATEFSFTPEDGLDRGEGTSVIGNTVGSYEIVCAVPNLGLSDLLGATLTITDAVPARVTTSLSPEIVKIGETSEATCVVTDDEGTEISLPTHVTATEDVSVDGHQVSSGVTGAHTVTCHATGFSTITEEGATLMVISGDPVAVELRVKPEKTVYKVGHQLTFSWVGLDAEGNEIPDLPGTLDLAVEGFSAIDVASNKYKAVKEGLYPVTVKLHAPYDALTDERTIIVDGTSPEIIITFPERGATLQGSGEAITILGTVTESVGSITSFVINGQAVGIGEDGSFSAEMTPEWGVNVIQVYAEDSNGNQGKLTPSYQYSSGYTSFVETNAEGVKVGDGMEIMLGQTFLDDGVHDPTDIDDAATLLEVVLSELDLESVINSSLSGLSGSQPLADIGPLAATFLYTVQVVPPTDVGVTKVMLDSVLGGIAFEIEIGDATGPGLDITFNVQGKIDLEALGFPVGEVVLNLNTGITVQKMKIAGTLMMDMPTGGDLSADLENLTLELEGIELDPIEDVWVDINVSIPFVITYSNQLWLSDIIDLNTLTDTILDPLVDTVKDVVLAVLEPTLDAFAGDIMAAVLNSFGISDTLELPNFLNPSAPPVEVQYYTDLTSAHFDDPGAELGLSIGFFTEKGIDREVLGAIQRNSCLESFPEEFTYDWKHELAMALKTDALNSLFFAIWWSGLLEGPLDIAELAGGGLPIPVGDLGMNMKLLSAPVINDCGKAAGVEIQVGDMFLDFSGSLLGIQLDADAYVDLTLLAVFKTSPEGFFIEVGDLKDFDIEVVGVGPNADYEDVKSLLEDELPNILGTFLVGQEFGPIALPTIDLGEIVPGVPGGSVLEFQDLEITKSSGYVVIEGELD